MKRRFHANRLTVIATFYLALLVRSSGLNASDSPAPQPWCFSKSKVSAQLKTFIAAKRAQANTLAAADGKELSPEIKSLFDAAENGDWRTTSNIWEAVRDHSSLYEYPTATNPAPSHVRQWQPALEMYGALTEFAAGGDKYPIAFGQDIIQSIPPGSIYFGGTGPGRFLVTALSTSHINGNPFFTLTQNWLGVDTYLDYLRSMYGSRISIPATGDVQRCFLDHTQDVQGRIRRGEKLDPNESATGIDARLDLEGCISKFIFDRNPDREFYVEESHIITWMYPYLEPHGLIMKLNREPLTQLDPEIVAHDREFWNALIKQLLTDPEFLSNQWARLTYSKHRSAIGGVYAYRRLAGNAEYALKQAVALDPKNPEANFRLAQLYTEQSRFDDGITVLKSLQQGVPSDEKLQAAISELEKLKQSKPTALPR